MIESSTYEKNNNVATYFNYDPNNIYVPNTVYGYYTLVDYFYTYTIAGVVVNKKAEFIISGLKIDSESSEGEEYGEKVASKLDIKNKMTKLARNYFAYGLGVLYPMPKVKKLLECKVCHTVYPLEKLARAYKPLYRYVDGGTYYYKCTNKECKNKGVDTKFKLIEEEVNDISEYTLAVWSPHQMSCIYNSVTDKKMWMYKCDDEMRKLVSERDHYTIYSTPENFLTSIAKDTRVVIPEGRIYILEYPTLTIKGVPIPPMVAAFQDLYQRQMYQKANRQIAEDILIPLRMLFPIWKGESGARPILNTQNMETWAKETRREISKWMEDKTYVPIMPVEIGTKNIWGEGKLLVLGDNLRSNMQDVLASMDTPLEFVYGGATWSRQNVSAITLENILRSFSNKMADPLGFIENRINQQLSKERKIKMRLDTPRLVDSMAETSVMHSLTESGKMSQRTFMKSIGKSYDDELRNLKREENERKEALIETMTNQAMAQVEAEKIMLKNEKEKRKTNRVEMLKDSLAQRAIEKDQLMFNIQMQEYQYEQQLKNQKALMQEQLKQQKQMLPIQIKGMKAQMREQLKQQKQMLPLQVEGAKAQMQEQLSQQKQMMPIQLAQMQEQIRINEESQLRMAKKMQKLTAMGIKKQIKAQARAQRELEAEDARRQQIEMQQQAVSMMTDKEKDALMVLPPDKQTEMIDSFIERAKMQQLYESLPDEMKSEMEEMNENEKMQMLEQLAAQQEQEQQLEEATQSDPGLQREALKRQISEQTDSDDIQRMAITYNKLEGVDKQKYKDEIMQEDTSLFAKVKDMADRLYLQETVAKLLNGTTASNTNTWARVVLERADLLDELMQEYNSQLTYKIQANSYAAKLIETYGTPEHDALMEEIKENCPLEFKKTIMAEFQKLISEETKDKETEYSEEQQAEIVEKINALDPESKKSVIESLKHEQPGLYSMIILRINSGETNE